MFLSTYLGFKVAGVEFSSPEGFGKGTPESPAANEDLKACEDKGLWV